MIRFLIFVGLLTAAQAASAGEDWNWQQASDWRLKFPMCDAAYNRRQSPVDLSNDRVYYDSAVNLIFDPSYYSTYKVVIKNVKDEFVRFEFDPSARPTVRASVYGQLTEYRLHSGHFHWGLPGNQYQSAGSEHTVNGVRYTAELHLVHYKSMYPNINEAIQAGNDSLLVIGVFIEATYETLFGTNDAMKNVLEQFTKIRNPGSNVTLNLTPILLIPTVTFVYNYEGGLTTPECNGIVQWFVYKSPIKIQHEQVNAALWNTYQSPRDSSYNLLGNNFRPVQDLGTRMIATNSLNEPVQAAPRTGLGLLALLAGLLVSRIL